MKSPSFLRTSLVGAVAMLAAVLAFPAASLADTFTLTVDHCSGGCGTAPFGTVTLTQNGANVDVTVHLASGDQFAKTGASDFEDFKFNATGVVLTDITVDPHAPVLIAQTGAFNGDGTGNFAFGITCPTCGNGGSGAFANDIVFHVANATIADLTAPNNLGNVFVADLLAANGGTGPVAALPVPAPVVGAGLPGLVFAGGGLIALARRRRKIA